eukprot:TRINITY_DN102001_c0_g1_i1.p1 TRINITY_DN102001_c0_g1~~TRINITY_DN102001_c0_g1_i1.p1  ORF type:complete len:534 (+),score=81.38 TRINITY_DN102001_c0_g1_i1:244-1845(+)
MKSIKCRSQVFTWLEFSILMDGSLYDVLVYLICALIRFVASAGVRVRRIAGRSAIELKCTGYSCGSLADAGYSASELFNVDFSCHDLRSAGFTAKTLKLELENVSASQLKSADYSYLELRQAGYTAADCRLALNSAARELLEAGYSSECLVLAGYTWPELAEASISASDLRREGLSARTMKSTLNLSAAALKAAGYSYEDLHDAGYTAAQTLESGNCTLWTLRTAGFTVEEVLADIRCFPAALLRAGYSCRQLRGAGYTAVALREAGYSVDDVVDVFGNERYALMVKNAFSGEHLGTVMVAPADTVQTVRVLLQAASGQPIASVILGEEALHATHFLLDCGVTSESCVSAVIGDFDVDQDFCSYVESKLHSTPLFEDIAANVQLFPSVWQSGITSRGFVRLWRYHGETLEAIAVTLKSIGCTAGDMHRAGYTAECLLMHAGYSVAEVVEGGYNLQQLRRTGCPAKELLALGYSCQSLVEAGYDIQHLLEAGATAEQIGESDELAGEAVRFFRTDDPKATVVGSLRTLFTLQRQ